MVIPSKMLGKIFYRVSKLRTLFSPFPTEKTPPEKMKMLIFHLISSSVLPSTPYMVVKAWCEESKMHPYQFWYTSRVLKVENAEISAVNSPESPLRK